MADDKGNGAGMGHNLAGLQDLIRTKSGPYLRIKQEREDLTEEMGEIREGVKAAGIDWKAFENGVKQSQSGDEERNHYLDSLRIVYEALGVGSQSTLFPDPEDGSVGDEQVRKAQQEGHDASFEGKKPMDNPYSHRDPRRASWQEGYFEQQAERAREMAPSEEPPAHLGGEDAGQETEAPAA